MFYLSKIKRRNALDLANHILTGDIFKGNHFRGLRSECDSLVDVGGQGGRRFTRTTGNIRENLED